MDWIAGNKHNFKYLKLLPIETVGEKTSEQSKRQFVQVRQGIT